MSWLSPVGDSILVRGSEFDFCSTGGCAMQLNHWDWIIIGSGFGGSVSALRLAEKGYRVLVIEKGRRFGPQDFPKTNWDLRRWMWNPGLGLRGIFQMSFLKHVTVLHGVGVGGGSLVYANTLPLPKDSFFSAPSWAELGDWKQELEPHYQTARRMLGAAPNPQLTYSDSVLQEIAEDIGRSDCFHPTEVAVFFGEPGKQVSDPYFDGDGPDRVGCTFCGSCMTGCRVGAKNTLDQNYLFLAERRGVEIRPETEVTAVRVREQGGYAVDTISSLGRRHEVTLTADQVIFAGGVMGTIPLLLKMREDPQGLPELSPRVGDSVRTNSESLIGVVAPNSKEDFTRGVAITSILNTDEHSHVEPVRFGPGSGFFRTLVSPHSPGSTMLTRVLGVIKSLLRHPVRWFRVLTVRDMPRRNQVLLYMRTLDGTLSMRLGRQWRTGYRRSTVTHLDDESKAPQAFIREATELAERFAEKTDGMATNLVTETVFGVPSTAHILGGACMGKTAEEGVINDRHQVFGYDGLYVIDGSAVSANPGVNPSLTITALAERCMSLIPDKSAGRPDPPAAAD